MFQFPPFAPAKLVTCLQHARLPHSEITGSIPVCSSPVLIAAYHVLHRLQKPRHPPFALVTFSLFVFFEWITRTLCLHLFSFTRCLEIAVHNVRIDSLLYHLYLVTDYLISFNFTSLSFLKLVNELSVFSQTGCKGTTFFFTSKFFYTFFHKNLQLFSHLLCKVLYINHIWFYFIL